MAEKEPSPTPGDERTKVWFAFLPVWIGRNIRWMEWVTVKQKFVRRRLPSMGAPHPFDCVMWMNWEFID